MDLKTIGCFETAILHSFSKRPNSWILCVILLVFTLFAKFFRFILTLHYLAMFLLMIGFHTVQACRPKSISLSKDDRLVTQKNYKSRQICYSIKQVAASLQIILKNIFIDGWATGHLLVGCCVEKSKRKVKYGSIRFYFQLHEFYGFFRILWSVLDG